MKNIIVVDTNVLLADPTAVLSYENAEVYIPQVVLAELDKLKSGRIDREIKFKGREVSRLLFNLSEHGQLAGGVQLDNDATIHVWTGELDDDLPGSLNLRNADDRIVGCALQLKKNPENHVVLLTNDLNMLVKAQTLGLEVRRHEEPQHNPALRVFQRWAGKRAPWLWLVLATVAAGIFVGLWLFRIPSPIVNAPSSLSQQLEFFAARELELVNLTKKDPTDIQSWIELGDTYDEWATQYHGEGRSELARSKRLLAIDSYSKAVDLDKGSTTARNRLGKAYYDVGNVDQAIGQFLQVLDRDPQSAIAHYNLGLILFEHGDNLTAAAREFQIYLRLEPNGQGSVFAKQALDSIEAQQKTKEAE